MRRDKAARGLMVESLIMWCSKGSRFMAGKVIKVDDPVVGLLGCTHKFGVRKRDKGEILRAKENTEKIIGAVYWAHQESVSFSGQRMVYGSLHPRTLMAGQGFGPSAPDLNGTGPGPACSRAPARAAPVSTDHISINHAKSLKG